MLIKLNQTCPSGYDENFSTTPWKKLHQISMLGFLSRISGGRVEFSLISSIFSQPPTKVIDPSGYEKKNCG